MFFRTTAVATLIAVSALSATCTSTAHAGVTTLTELDRGEPYDAMSFQNGYLFVGSSRTDFNPDFHLRIYDRKDQLVKDIAMRHSVQHIRRYSNTAVVAVGTAYENSIANTYYSIITVTAANKFAVRTVKIPIDAWAQDWIGNVGGREYFADMGGNPHDEQSDPTLPAQTIFSTDSNGSPRYMTTRLRGPNFGITFGADLVIARFDSIQGSANFLARVNTKTGVNTTAIKGTFQRIHDIKVKPGSNLIAISEREGAQITLGDLQSGSVVGSAPMKGTSGSLEWFGKCLVGSNVDEKKVLVFDATDVKAPKLLKTIPFDDTGKIFAGMRGMTMDLETGRVYGRSAYPCNPMITHCDKTENSVAVLDLATSKEIFGLCH